MPEIPDEGEEYQARYAIEALRSELKNGFECWGALLSELAQMRMLFRNWAIVGLAVVLAVTVIFIGYVSWVGLSALRENTRTLAKLGELAVGNRDMVAIVRADLEQQRKRMEIVHHQLDLIHSQILARKRK